MLPQPHYQADGCCGHSGLVSSTVNSFKAEDKNLSAVPCVENLRASVSASQQESDKGGKLSQQSGD